MLRSLAVGSVLLLLGPGMSTAALSDPPASGGDSNIDSARWEDYKKDYPASQLCTADEITLWTCDGKKKTYSLCSSHDITETSGYIQYRVGAGRKVGFEYPAQKRPPKGLFDYTTSMNGNASISFQNGGYTYTLFDPLRDASSIEVSKGADDKQVAEISCTNPNQSLQLNYTIKLMGSAGIASP